MSNRQDSLFQVSNKQFSFCFSVAILGRSWHRQAYPFLCTPCQCLCCWGVLERGRSLVQGESLDDSTRFQLLLHRILQHTGPGQIKAGACIAHALRFVRSPNIKNRSDFRDCSLWLVQNLLRSGGTKPTLCWHSWIFFQSARVHLLRPTTASLAHEFLAQSLWN